MRSAGQSAMSIRDTAEKFAIAVPVGDTAFTMMNSSCITGSTTPTTVPPAYSTRPFSSG